MEKINRINERKKHIGTRTDRRLNKFTDNFLEIFIFYFFISRYNICSFSGSIIDIESNSMYHNARFAFREYDNGRFRNSTIKTKHPNILYHVINGKKAWGLWCKEWAIGISSCDFTKDEILDVFNQHKIIIPKSLNLEFDNLIHFYKIEKYKNCLK